MENMGPGLQTPDFQKNLEYPGPGLQTPDFQKKSGVPGAPDSRLQTPESGVQGPGTPDFSGNLESGVRAPVLQIFSANLESGVRGSPVPRYSRIFSGNLESGVPPLPKTSLPEAKCVDHGGGGGASIYIYIYTYTLFFFLGGGGAVGGEGCIGDVDDLKTIRRSWPLVAWGRGGVAQSPTPKHL